TYAPWTDPSYWNDGLQNRFSGAAQRRVLESNLWFYATTVLPPMIVLLVLVFCFGGLTATITTALRTNWPLLVPAAVGLAVYAIGTDLVAADIATQPSTRFVAPFVTVAFAVTLAAVRLPEPATAAAASRTASVAAAAIAVAVCVHTIRSLAATSASPPSAWSVADRLHQAGLVAGERVAILGRKYDRDG